MLMQTNQYRQMPPLRRQGHGPLDDSSITARQAHKLLRRGRNAMCQESHLVSYKLQRNRTQSFT